MLLVLGLSSVQFSYADNGIEANSISNDIVINVFPNPATGVINLELNGDYSIQFFDLVGQKLSVEMLEKSFINGDKKVSFDIQNLPQGIYFIKVTDEISKTQKMIKFKKL